MLFSWLHKQPANIIDLQETYSSPEVERQWTTEWGGQVIHAGREKDALIGSCATCDAKGTGARSLESWKIKI